ncbi:MAG: hypothetical protein K2W96_02770, partial [Gemmataceae bacterium]|nr:hypothetical protein [Gemmataceae bacterium]
RLAEQLRESGQKPAAADEYRKCMEYDSRWAYLARYQLAMADLEAGQPDAAEAGLVFNLKLLRFEREPEAKAQSLFALGNLLYQKREFSHVVRYLQDAVPALKDEPKYKDAPETTRARFQLADSYRQMALLESRSLLSDPKMRKEDKEHFKKEHAKRLKQAAEEFTALEAYLDSPAGKDHLTADLRLQVPFIAAKCWFALGGKDNIERSLGLYEKLIERHSGGLARLDALGGAVSCHDALGQETKVRQRLLQVKDALDKPGIPAEDRKAWEDWEKLATSRLKKGVAELKEG